MESYSVDVAAIAYKLKDTTNWWRDINGSRLWQDRIFHILAALYGLVAAVALVQLIRIQMRVPEYGWTTQKVFHFLNFLVNGVRALVFVFRRSVQNLHPEIAMWLILWWKYIPVLVILSKMFFAGVSLFAALGFLLYGGRLFLMLQRFPVESKGRRKKLQEVGYVTTICFTCFLVRCIMMCFNAFDKGADLDVLNHPILNLIYYLLVEILPSSLVLFILRKLPPKRESRKQQ
ncbi:hypothetical protein ES332_D13G028500v1 [Gossypium tomentosum]|uniref:THH1/TOM1/TOM3 domain-containing protein n=1 Tax=Gossypium tomentosum TaxID=34277 RepID=A0A5D2HS96_GOSTO|nr:hypothetical protein ES332_D13G028500v1 [Gossypium tomentosum]